MKIGEFAEVIGYNRKTFTRIFNGNHVDKKTVISIGVAFGLNFEHMQMFLDLQGYALTPTIPLEEKYIEVIQKINGRGGKRIAECNIALIELGIEEQYLFGNFTRQYNQKK